MYIIVYSITNSFYSLNYFYQIINFLNTKNNMVFLFIILSLVLKNSLKSNNNILKVICIVTWFFYVSVGLDGGRLVFFYIQHTNNLNTNLLNGIMLIHPWILYFFYVVYLLEYKVIFKRFLFLKKKYITHVKKKNYTNGSLLILVAILLGCWWAEQELSWGGWWSWDFVELLAVNYLLYYLILLHRNSNKETTKVVFMTKPLVFVIAVISVRFNLINSIHNFASVESQNQYYYYITALLVYMLCFLIYSGFILNLKPYNLFWSLIVVFVVCFLGNLLESFKCISSITVKINILPNIKILFITITLVTLVIWVLHKKVNIGLYIVLLLLYFILLNQRTTTLLDLIGLSLVLLFLKKSKTTFGVSDWKVTYIHMLLVFLLILTIHQIYNFIPSLKYILNFDIFTQSTNNFLITNQHNIFLNTDYKKNVSDFTQGLLKSIFEKSMFFLDNNIFELYNYNYQTLIQTYGTCIVAIFFILILIFFSVVYNKNARVWI